MKKLMLISLIVASVGALLVMIASILSGTAPTNSNFQKDDLETVMYTLGYAALAFGGILLVVGAVVKVVKGGDTKKLILTTAITLGVGVALILAVAILNGIQNLGSEKFSPQGLIDFLEVAGYLLAAFSTVLLVAFSTVAVVKAEKKGAK